MQFVVYVIFILSSSTLIKSQIRNASFRKLFTPLSRNGKCLKEYSLKHVRTTASMTCSARCLQTTTCTTFSVCRHNQDSLCRLYDVPDVPDNVTEVSGACQHYLMFQGAPENIPQLTTVDVALMTTTNDVEQLTSTNEISETTTNSFNGQTSTESTKSTAATVDETSTVLSCGDINIPFLVTNSQASFGCSDCDCISLQSRVSGEYVIDISGKLIRVVCVFDENHSWTVIQRRFDDSVNFYRNWQQYADGFGCTTSDLWLGNDNIHLLTYSGHNKLRIEMEDEEGHLYYADYTNITVDSSDQNYRLHVDSSGYHGNIPDSLGGRCVYCHDNMMFSTFDMDNDDDPSDSCALNWRGAWWYRMCFHLNLNGELRTRNFVWWNGDSPNYLVKSRMILRK